jgi:tetratricopeptide (TPR) repeat protein
MAASLERIAERVCQSETFRSSPRLREFLLYLAKQTAGQERLKETLIGMEFFQRAPGYDPRKDPIVRVEAHRLRRRLLDYYRTEGAVEPWRMELPAGAYCPVLRRAGQASRERRLAVRVDASDPLTAEGLTAELIRQLGCLEGVTVLAPASSLGARDAKEAARQLGANAILECRLDGAKLQACLSHAEGDRLEPIGTFDNLIQPAVEALAQFVAAHLGARRPTGTAPRPPLDLETYQHYLLGRAWFHRWSPENLVRAQRSFEQALARRPDFAPACAGIANIQVLRAYWHEERARPVLERGFAYASKAAELDPGCADAYCSLGALRAVLHHDWAESENLFRLALRANPNDALALNWLAIIALVPQLQFAEAVDAVFAAYDLDPASPEIGNEIVWVRLCCSQYAEAAEQSRRIVELHPEFLEAYWSLALAESSCGRHADAIRALDRADRVGGPAPMTLALRCHVAGAQGDAGAARQSLARLESSTEPGAGRAIFRAWAWAALGEVDRGISYLHRAVDDADPHALYVETFPPNAPLRAHPQYADVLRRQRLGRVGAPEVSTSV